MKLVRSSTKLFFSFVNNVDFTILLNFELLTIRCTFSLTWYFSHPDDNSGGTNLKMIFCPHHDFSQV